MTSTSIRPFARSEFEAMSSRSTYRRPPSTHGESYDRPAVPWRENIYCGAFCPIIANLFSAPTWSDGDGCRLPCRSSFNSTSGTTRPSSPNGQNRATARRFRCSQRPPHPATSGGIDQPCRRTRIGRTGCTTQWCEPLTPSLASLLTRRSRTPAPAPNGPYFGR